MNRPKLFRAQEWIVIAILVFLLFSMVSGGGASTIFGLGIWFPLTCAVVVMFYFTRRRKLREWDRINDPANFPAPPPPVPSVRIAANRDEDNTRASAAANARAAERTFDQAERARRMREGG